MAECGRWLGLIGQDRAGRKWPAENRLLGAYLVSGTTANRGSFLTTPLTRTSPSLIHSLAWAREPSPSLDNARSKGTCPGLNPDLEIGFFMLHHLPRAPSGGPCPVQIVPAQPAGHIDHFADKIQWSSKKARRYRRRRG